ncbi:FAD-binding protein [Legionella drancourtii]|uniref:Cytokinin oxidase n=1 Tax=Legionella drancourtii LLAP12 TaxID=658187 RepID=G9ERZ7_9GAMM|nr:FAD-binding protein [Legionella drancourtii]EHL29778.1 cytokinin oxidase [Legionella drancourtii LLAP12]
MPQLEMKWNTQHIANNEKKLGPALLCTEQALHFFREDFGKLTYSTPAAVCEPTTISELQELMRYAYEYQLPVTIRGNGMSQSGQSLAPPGGLIVSMKYFNQTQAPDQYAIWVDANASWANLLERTLPQALIPYVLPHNCNLSIGGILSAGGVGAASFKYGSIVSHVTDLEVMHAHGELVQINKDSPLMQACLGGQGFFGLITKARIALRPCLQSIRTFFLVYLDKETWLNDLQNCKKHADHVEAFCTSAIQGAKLSAQGRQPFSQWFYALHVSVEYDNDAPDFSDLALAPWKLVHTQDESIHTYLHRHDSRFNAMKMTGQWNLQHPWYECFVSSAQLANLEELLAIIPIHYTSIVHIVSVANNAPTGFMMLPEGQDIFALMILTPGLSEQLVPSCLQTIKNLDATFLTRGGKRYLSGYLGESPDTDYWKNHFGTRYKDWLKLKKTYDPRNIFCSVLHKPEHQLIEA